jgi:DNA-binding NtrC family response regulator
MAKGKILVVDDEDLVRWSIREKLQKGGYTVVEAPTGAAGLEAAQGSGFDLAILDMKLPDTDGLSLMKELVRTHPDLQVVIMTAFSTVETAVEAMKLGASDYLPKPFNLDALTLVVGRALETSNLRREVTSLR